MLLVLPLLTSCFAAHERRLAKELIADGDLVGAHRILENLVAEGETQDTDALLEVRRQIAADHFERAMNWRRRGYDSLAFQELGKALLHHPQHVPARHLALRVGDEAATLRDWVDRYRGAIDAGDAELALDLLVAAERDGLQQRHYGVVQQLVVQAWDTYKERFEAARLARRIADMQQAIAAAEQFLDRHRTFVQTTEIATCTQLDHWRAALRTQEVIEGLVVRAERAHKAQEHAAALHEIRQAQLLDPECCWLHRRLGELRAIAVEAWLGDLRQAADENQWEAALALWRRLEGMGIVPDGADGDLTLPSIQQLRAEELLVSAARLEREGRTASALLALIQAQQLHPALVHGSVQGTVVRLRSELRARPLVEVGREISAEAAIAPIVVRQGTAAYEERRLPRLKQRGDVLLPEQLQERGNPSYEAERSRWRALQQQYEVAQRQHDSAAPRDQEFLASRCAHMQRSLERMRVRLDQMQPTELRLSWKSETWETETWELIAELELPVELHRIGQGWQTQRVAAQLRALDQTRASDAARSVPEDPNELPATSAVRAQLDRECQLRFDELLVELRAEARSLLCRRAQESLGAGDAADATEDLVWVILSSPSLHDPIRARAARLLEEAACPDSVVEAL
ncbi:MAG: hypothetical protein AAF581_19165 [Planctomycetota bacterium]